MFSMQAVPGIISMQPIEIVTEFIHDNKKAPVRMPVEKSANQSLVNSAADDALLTHLYEHYRRPIHSYAFRLLGSIDDADDITQEVFVRACMSWESLYERDNLSSWLYRIATNLCVDMLRRRKRISWWPLLSRHQTSDGTFEEINADVAPFWLIMEVFLKSLNAN